MSNAASPSRRSPYITVVTVIVVLFDTLGCTSHDHKTTSPKNLQKTNAFAPFKNVESIHIKCNFNNGFAECQIPESQHARFKSIFEYGTPVPNDVKRVGIAELEFVADGEKHNWALLDLADDECGLLIVSTSPPKELWSGIKTSDFIQFVKDCLEYRPMPQVD